MQSSKAYIMLVCATLFWAGNFTIAKFAYLENIPPYSLAFLRWCLVWIILFPFTYKEIFKLKKIIKKNFSLFLILGSTSVCIFTSFTYNALNYTQVINASLFNTAIPVTIILVCFILKIEKTNIFQISGLLISVLGILAIITRLDLHILLSLNFNRGDLFMIGAIIAWGIYSAYLKKRDFEVPLLTLIHIICTFGLIFLLPLFISDLIQGKIVQITNNLFYILIYIAIFPSIGSYYCWAGAVSIIGANRAGIFLSLIPLFSTLMAIFFYNEQFQFFHLIGAILIILGLFLSNKEIKNA
ncbi:DMT family transporter [Candidatus Pelagibacter communis]|uniref:DMT family transporter n=1 Tax=Pelagibacter ubique TaxID=198252 RepID=UPI00094CB7C4|nr:DMT family transporter [Candidatus Pelagibacter ubique]